MDRQRTKKSLYVRFIILFSTAILLLAMEDKTVSRQARFRKSSLSFPYEYIQWSRQKFAND